MYCPTCAHQNIDGSARCEGCGAFLPAPPGYAPGYPQPPCGYPPAAAYTVHPTRTSGMAIAGFVLSFFCGVLGLIFSILGYNECKSSNGIIEGQGLALAGIVISIIQLAIVLLYFIVIAAAASRW